MKRVVVALSVLFLSSCVPTYERVKGIDGRTYFAYSCSDYGSCKQGIYEKCAGDYEMVSDAALPLVKGSAPRQIYFPGSDGLSGGGRVVFTCEPKKRLLTAADIRQDIENYKEFVATGHTYSERE